MKPFIGKRFHQEAQKRILLLGESFYQPHGATLHLQPQTWYSSSHAELTLEQLNYIDTQNIITESAANGLKNRAHSIYREIAKALNSTGPNYPEYKHAIEHCAYLNYFQRPAEVPGKSIRKTSSDIEISNQVLDVVISSLRPNLVICVSRLAGAEMRNYASARNLSFVSVPHPASQWWNRSCLKYGGLKGRELLAKHLVESKWFG